MQELYICKILFQPLLHPVFLPDGRTHELETVAKNYEGKTKAQFLCPFNREPIDFVTYAFDLKTAIDNLYENKAKQNQDNILAPQTSSSISSAKGKERIQNDESENKISTHLEPRYQGYKIYTKEEYLDELTRFIKQNDPDRKFQMPSKLVPQITNPITVANSQILDSQKYEGNNRSFSEYALPQNSVNILPPDIELPHPPIPNPNDLEITPAGEADHLIRRDRFFPRQIDASPFSEKVLSDDERIRKNLLRGAGVSTLISTGLIGAIFLYTGIDSYNKNFQLMAIQAAHDIANNCFYNATMLQNNPVPLASVYHYNLAATLISSMLTVPFLALSYAVPFTIRPDYKYGLWCLSSMIISSLTIAMATIGTLFAINKQDWMLIRGQAAGYNSEYAFLCQNNTATQHCININPTQCHLGLNGNSSIVPDNNKMTLFGAEIPLGFSFFTGYGGLTTLILLNSIAFAAIYAIQAICQRYGLDPLGHNAPAPAHYSEDDEAPRYGYGAV